jgi:hypothetical protein
VQIGDTIFYAGGPRDRQSLMAASLATGRVWQATQALGRIDVLVADPVAKKVFVSTDGVNVSSYDDAAHKVTLCQ